MESKEACREAADGGGHFVDRRPATGAAAWLATARASVTPRRGVRGSPWGRMDATSNKCIASSNKCITNWQEKNTTSFLLLVMHLLLVVMHLLLKESMPYFHAHNEKGSNLTWQSFLVKGDKEMAPVNGSFGRSWRLPDFLHQPSGPQTIHNPDVS